MGDFICVVPSGYQHSTHWVSWLQVTLAFQKEKHAPLQAFCFLKWPLGADTQSQHTTRPSFTATKCGGFYSSFLRIFKSPRSICWLFCKIPINFWGGDLMFWSLEYHVVWHWWPPANLPRMNLMSPRPDFLHPHSWCAMVWAGTITTLLFLTLLWAWKSYINQRIITQWSNYEFFYFESVITLFSLTSTISTKNCQKVNGIGSRFQNSWFSWKAIHVAWLAETWILHTRGFRKVCCSLFFIGKISP